MSKDSILCPIRWFFAADENRGHTHAENNCLPIFFRIETTFRQRRTTKMTQRWQKPTFPQNQGKVQHFYDYLRPGWSSAGWTLVDHQVTLGVSLCFASCLCALFKRFSVSGFFGCGKFNKYWDWMVWMVQVERHQMEVGTKCSCLQELIKYLYFFILENWKIYEQEHSMSWCNHKHSWSKIHYNIWSSTPVTRAEISLGPLRKEKSRQLLQKKTEKVETVKSIFYFPC